jgi:hypothetical protein
MIETLDYYTKPENPKLYLHKGTRTRSYTRA